MIQPRRFSAGSGDDVELLAGALNLPRSIIKGLLQEVNRFPHARVSNLRFERDSEDGLEVLRLDMQGVNPGVTLRGMSGGEAAGVVLELATAAARLSGRYVPTLLVLEEIAAIFVDGFFDKYSHHLLDPGNQFQTLMCLPEKGLNLDNVLWNGWQIIHTYGERSQLRFTQGIRAM